MSTDSELEKTLRKEILQKVKEYYLAVHRKEFVKGKTYIQYAGRVYDENEMMAMADSLLDFTLTYGKYGRIFETKFAEFLSAKYGILTNSGSSANLLAISTLCSKSLKEKRLKKGDEVITPATTFPTTLNPIIQNNLIPVFLDIEMDTLNINAENIENAISPKTKAIFIPHTLGNPNNMDRIMEVADRHDLFVVEDSCDALGSKYNGRYVGTFGDMGTVSFFPAHHMTMGEGGAVFTNSSQYKLILQSLRDWGRACWCDPGKSNTCGMRFDFRVSGIQYDHKYIYSEIGYNLKALDLQAAMGLEQLKKLPEFIHKRKDNFSKIFHFMKNYEEHFILPRSLPKADPSWFCFPLTIKDDAGFTRRDITTFLEENLIATRLIFGGNIIYQDAYRDLQCRIAGKLENSDTAFKNTFFIGVYPGIGNEEIQYIKEKFGEFLSLQKR